MQTSKVPPTKFTNHCHVQSFDGATKLVGRELVLFGDVHVQIAGDGRCDFLDMVHLLEAKISIVPGIERRGAHLVEASDQQPEFLISQPADERGSDVLLWLVPTQVLHFVAMVDLSKALYLGVLHGQSMALGRHGTHGVCAFMLDGLHVDGGSAVMRRPRMLGSRRSGPLHGRRCKGLVVGLRRAQIAIDDAGGRHDVIQSSPSAAGDAQDTLETKRSA